MLSNNSESDNVKPNNVWYEPGGVPHNQLINAWRNGSLMVAQGDKGVFREEIEQAIYALDEFVKPHKAFVQDLMNKYLSPSEEYDKQEIRDEMNRLPSVDRAYELLPYLIDVFDYPPVVDASETFAYDDSMPLNTVVTLWRDGSLAVALDDKDAFCDRVKYEIDQQEKDTEEYRFNSEIGLVNPGDYQAIPSFNDLTAMFENPPVPQNADPDDEPDDGPGMG